MFRSWTSALWLTAAAFFALLVGPGAFAQSAGCQVTYTVSWSGGNGFGANIEIRNTGPAITNGWTLLFSFPSGQRIQNGWPVNFSQPAGSAQVTVSSNAARSGPVRPASTKKLTLSWNGLASSSFDLAADCALSASLAIFS